MLRDGAGMCLRKKEMRHMIIANPNSNYDVFWGAFYNEPQ